jgi:hypothetical protein
LEPGQDDAGSYNVTINVSDGNGGSTYETITISVADVPTTERVTDSLEVLYYFDNVSGSTINPTAGAAAIPLQISNTGSVSSVANGLRVNSPVVIASSGTASTLVSHLVSANEITIEAWIQPASPSMSGGSNGGLAQIVSLSEWSWNGTRDFTLGQSGSQYKTLLRVAGWEAGLSGGSVNTSEPVHIIYTWYYKKNPRNNAKLYINGSAVAAQSLYNVGLSEWQNYRLVLANEDGTAPWGGSLADYDWAGTYYLVAIYSKALSDREIQQNYEAAGPWS